MKKSAITILRLLVLSLCVCGIILLLHSLVIQKTRDYEYDNIYPLRINGNISINNGPFVPITENIWKGNDIHNATVIGTFHRPIRSEESFVYLPRNLRVRLSVNGREMFHCRNNTSLPKFKQFAGNSARIADIGEVKTTDTIQIDMEKVYDIGDDYYVQTMIDYMYVAKEGDVYQSFFTIGIIHPFIGFMIILFGCMIIILGLFQCTSQFKNLKYIWFLGLFCIFGGFAYLYDSCYSFIDFVFPYPVWNTISEFLFPNLLIFCCLIFISGALKRKCVKRFIYLLSMYYFVTRILGLFLQFMGILDFYAIRKANPITGSTFVIVGGIALIYEYLKSKDRELLKVMFTILPLMLAIIPKVADVILFQTVERAYLRMGILATCCILFYRALTFTRKSILLLEQEQKLKMEMQNAQIAIMLGQIQPHFLFNALNTLQHICTKNGVLAAEAISHFSKYLRGNMDSLTKEHPIPFGEELEHVKHYLYIQKLRFGDRIHIQYDLNNMDFDIPTLTLQPIVENAIRHGITKKAEGGTVWITTLKVLDEYIIIVADDGVGFDPHVRNCDRRSHIGLQNVEKRIKLQCDGSLSIESQPGFGTRVTIRLKGNEHYENYDS